MYSGLAKYWVSPEALPFLEITSERALDVSEHDAKKLLEDHFLPLPVGETWSFQQHVPFIEKVFSLPTLKDIVEALRDPPEAHYLFALAC